MDHGTPVTITLNTQEDTKNPPMHTDQLYCQIVHQARWGKTSHITTQHCTIGKHVLGQTQPQTTLAEYYHNKKRYKTHQAAKNITQQLPTLKTTIKNIKITPYPQKNYDLLILYLTPEKAMKLIQANSYHTGERTTINTAGVASICADCTAQPHNTQKITLSLGCKGSRKHSKYADTELIATIPKSQIKKIEEALKKIPDTHN
jgi:uncharacterized protein (DUF169 family)